MVPSSGRLVRRCFALVVFVAVGPFPGTLADAAGCPTNVVYTPDGVSNLDLGWSGQSHFMAMPGWSMRLGVTNCAGSTVGSCGECSISSILPAADGRNARCTNDTSVVCIDDAPCASGGGHCAIFAAPPTTIAISSVKGCVVNEIVPPVTGTLQVESGGIVLTLRSRATVHEYQCPLCNGDAVANDGLAGGTCAGGERNGLSCDANASSPLLGPEFGATSFDCPPEADAYGDLILPTTPLTLGTGTQTRTITTASPICTDGTGRRCHCETCNDADATPCSSNADCVAVGASVCGGKRCIGGLNATTPCGAPSECPGGFCGAVGEVSSPNACLDDTATALDERSCPDTAPVDGEGVCAAGPVRKHCSGLERWAGCAVNDDCPSTHLCIAENTPCFPGGSDLGATVPASGTASPRVGDVSDPTNLAGFFCGHPTTAYFDVYASNPGLARLTLAGSLTYADDVVPTPTATPVPTATATPGPCPASPASCRGSVASGKSSVALTDKSPDDKDQLQWKWAAGAATAKSDFGDPLTTDDYVLCLYDGSGARASIVVPHGGTCDGKPCWKDQKKGFQYKAKTPVPGGITQLQLAAGADGKARIAVKGKGAALPDVPVSSLTSPVTLQIRPSNGSVCFGSTFSFPPAVKNDGVQFKDKGD
jgi:hypothetical protein